MHFHLKTILMTLAFVSLSCSNANLGSKSVGVQSKPGSQIAKSSTPKSPSPKPSASNVQLGSIQKQEPGAQLPGPQETSIPKAGQPTNIPTPPATGFVPATAPSYANSSTTLYRFDPSGGGLTTIGNFNIADSVSDIAINSEGEMMACSLSSLYKIDPTTAALTFVASIQGPSYGQWTGLTFLADGRLLVGGDGIYELDRRSGMTRAIVGQGSISVSGDMAGMPDGKVYASVKSKSPGGSDVLVAVDPNAFNSVAQPLFELPSDGSILGLGYVNGIALGFTESGKVMMVNILTEKTSVLSTGVQFWGAATAPAL